MPKRANWTSEDNPRHNLEHRERGPVPWLLTTADIAKVLEATEASVREMLPVKTRTLAALFAYAIKRWKTRSTRLEESFIAELLEGDYPKWQARWPLLDIWTCGVPDCEELRLERGFCGKHGGHVLIELTNGGPGFRVRVGGAWIPLGRLLAGVPEGRFVSHKDGNRWNCRPENLRIETPDEHAARHQTFPFEPPRTMTFPNLP